MPSILTECGFIDNSLDASLLKQDDFIDGLAQGHVNGLVKAFGLIKKEVARVAYQIQLTENQQKDKDVLVRRGYMAKDYKVLSGEMVALITMQATMVRDLEKNGALK